MSFSKVRSIVQTFLAYEIWIILAFTGLGFLSTRFLSLAVLIGAIFGGLRWYRYGFLSVKTSVDGAVLLLLLMLPVTLWVTGEPETTQIQVYRLLNGIALFYCLVNWANSVQRLRLLLNGLMLLSILLAFYAAVSVEWTTQKIPLIPAFLYERFALLVGDTVHRNVMGGTLILILPISSSLLLFSCKFLSKRELGLFLFAEFVVLGILILTQSRGALLAFVIAAFILVGLRWKWGWGSLLILTLVGIFFIFRLGFGGAIAWLTSKGLLDELPGRFEAWHRAGYIIQDFPFTGIGMGTYRSVVDDLYPLILAEPGSVPHAHNLFLQVAVDLGIPGFVAWMAILWTATYTAWTIYRAGKTNGDLWLAGVGAGLLGSQLAMILHGILDAVTWGMVRPAPLVWGIWGLIFAYARVTSSKQQPSENPLLTGFEQSFVASA